MLEKGRGIFETKFSNSDFVKVRVGDVNLGMILLNFVSRTGKSDR